MTRALFTLIGAAVAGGLIWVAAQVDGNANGDWWARIGIVAAAGLALALARLPDVGVRTLAPSMPTFALAFLPALVAAGWVIVASQPSGNTYRGHVLAWSSDMGLTRVVRDLGASAAVLAFGLGVLFGLVFERRVVEVVTDEPGVGERVDEPLYAPATPVEDTTVPDRELVRQS